MRAEEHENLLHARRRGMRCAAMRADDRCARARRPKQASGRARADFSTEGRGVRGCREKMGDDLLQPRHNICHAGHSFFREEAVHFIAQAHFDSAVPKPANSDIDFAVVYSLKLGGQFHERPFPIYRPPTPGKYAPHELREDPFPLRAVRSQHVPQLRQLLPCPCRFDTACDPIAPAPGPAMMRQHPA